jgi:hypothetical protein
MSDESDPLEGAAIGETRTIEHETEFGFWSGDGADPYVGFDRDHENLTVESAEIVGEHGSERVRIEYSADVTKEPEPYPNSAGNGDESDGAPGGFHTPPALRIVGFGLLTAAGVGVVSAHVMRDLGVLALAEPTPLSDLWPAVAIIVLATLAIGVMMPYLPGMAGRGGRI